MIRVLIIFSNSPGQAAGRHDVQDRTVSNVLLDFEGKVEVDRRHATEIDDIHALITKGSYDLIHISGCGSEHGVYLDRFDLDEHEGGISARTACSVPWN